MNKSLSFVIQDAAKILFEQADMQSICRFFSQNYVVHLTNRDYSSDNTIIQSSISQVHKAFLKLHIEVDVLVEAGDKVAWQRTFSGIQEGAYKGFPACQREITWRDMVVSRIEGGLIAEEWLTSDLAEQLLASRKNRE